MKTLDQMGNVPLNSSPALVLLSGGFDSVAALCWTQLKHARVAALTFSYGQPHRDAEVVAAGRTARARGVHWLEVALADTLLPLVGGQGFLGGVVDHDDADGVNPAFVPGRNLVFLATALAHAMALWPHEAEYTLVMGCCREDSGAFPDCGEAFLRSADNALSLAVARAVHVAAPWVRMPKAGILTELLEQRTDEEGVQLVQESWSCYRGGAAPCGTCTACVLRARAFAVHSMPDLCSAPVMHGGDPHRERMQGG